MSAFLFIKCKFYKHSCIYTRICWHGQVTELSDILLCRSEEMAEFSDLEIINTMVLWFQRGKLSLSPSDCFDNAFSLFKVKMCYDAESK